MKVEITNIENQEHRNTANQKVRLKGLNSDNEANIEKSLSKLQRMQEPSEKEKADAQIDDSLHKEFEKLQMENNVIRNPERFNRENFPEKSSYDAKADEAIRKLIKKGTVPIISMNPDGVNAKERIPAEKYTADEIRYIKAEREKVDMPNEHTVMQKVIGVDTGNIEKDLEEYLSPTSRVTGEQQDAQVYGYVSKAEDSIPFIDNPRNCYETLRLDYEGTMYRDSGQAIYIVRYTDGTNYEIPFNKVFGGTTKDTQPCTGNGFIGSPKIIIPEFKVFPVNGKGAVITDGEIYKLYPDGKEELVATFDEDFKKFIEKRGGSISDRKI